MSRRLVSLTGHEMLLSPGNICVGTDPGAGVVVTPETGLQPRHFTIDTAAIVARLQVFEGCKAWLNGQPVRAAELRDGDLIAAGALELRFVDDESPKEEAGGALPAPPPVS